MIYRQQHFSRTTHLELREHGLYLSQHNGAARFEAELAYEEILPVQFERRRHNPLGQLSGRVLIWGAVIALNLGRGTWPQEGLTDAGWGLAFGSGFALLALYFYGSRYWWNTLVINTSRATVIVPDGGAANRAAAAKFALALEKRAKTYLRQEHAQVNPLALIEPQLRRLRWLHRLDVLSEAEAQALTTRLTGRRGGPELRGMGQRLEAPYLN